MQHTVSIWMLHSWFLFSLQTCEYEERRDDEFWIRLFVAATNYHRCHCSLRIGCAGCPRIGSIHLLSLLLFSLCCRGRFWLTGSDASWQEGRRQGSLPGALQRWNQWSPHQWKWALIILRVPLVIIFKSSVFQFCLLLHKICFVIRFDTFIGRISFKPAVIYFGIYHPETCIVINCNQILMLFSKSALDN